MRISHQSRTELGHKAERGHDIPVKAFDRMRKLERRDMVLNELAVGTTQL